jgi:hypothetical protein
MQDVILVVVGYVVLCSMVVLFVWLATQYNVMWFGLAVASVMVALLLNVEAKHDGHK